jgi:hypothetical protein
MKDLKYLNAVLTVIAVCLVILTLSIIGVIPKANASSPARFATVPVNADGSINVRFDTEYTMKVDIHKVSGRNVLDKTGTNATSPLPVIVMR